MFDSGAVGYKKDDDIAASCIEIADVVKIAVT